MLVLSRFRNESIIITPPGQPPIRVTVVDVQGNKVKLGIDAGRDVVIMREELTRGKKDDGDVVQ